jgi:hypothetical protein
VKAQSGEELDRDHPRAAVILDDEDGRRRSSRLAPRSNRDFVIRSPNRRCRLLERRIDVAQSSTAR